MQSIRSCFPSSVSVFGRGFPDYSVKRLTQQQQKRLIANCGRHCIFSSFLISSLSHSYLDKACIPPVSRVAYSGMGTTTATMDFGHGHSANRPPAPPCHTDKKEAQKQ